MFRAVLDEHARQQAALATHRDLHLAAGQQHAGKSAAIIVQHLDSIVRQVHDTQRAIEQQSRLVKDELARFQTNSRQLAGLIRQVNSMLREVGDFENYVAVVEAQTQRLAVGVKVSEIPAEHPESAPTRASDTGHGHNAESAPGAGQAD